MPVRNVVRPQRVLRLATRTTEAATMEARVAFTTTDRKHVDQHFGSATGFAIYVVTPESARLEGIAEFAPAAMDGEEGKLAARIELLAGCAAVYCQAVGASAVQQLLAAGVQPMRVESGSAIDGLLREFQADWRTAPPPWLQKYLRRGNASDARFDAFAEEGWDE